MLDLYTDGSCLNGRNDDWCAGFGFVFHNERRIIAVGMGSVLNGTNNIAELSAVISGLSWLIKRGLENSRVRVVSDSMYTINCFNKFRWVWDQRGYLSKEGNEIKNKELIIYGCNILDKFKYYPKFMWVKGHAGNKYNELADKLAGVARKRQITPIVITKRDRISILVEQNTKDLINNGIS